MTELAETFKLEHLVISDFLSALGSWSNHIVIGGGYALMVYKLYFSDQTIGIPPIGTKAVIEMKELGQQHPKWFRKLQKHLFSWLEFAAPKDWSNLELQDPSGTLKALQFERLLREITYFYRKKTY